MIDRNVAWKIFDEAWEQVRGRRMTPVDWSGFWRYHVCVDMPAPWKNPIFRHWAYERHHALTYDELYQALTDERDRCDA